MKCPDCLSRLHKGKCICGFVDRRKIHSMVAPEKERRNKKHSAWDTAPVWAERRW